MNKRRRFKAKRRRRVRVLAQRLWKAWADYTWFGIDVGAGADWTVTLEIPRGAR